MAQKEDTPSKEDIIKELMSISAPSKLIGPDNSTIATYKNDLSSVGFVLVGKPDADEMVVVHGEIAEGAYGRAEKTLKAIKLASAKLADFQTRLFTWVALANQGTRSDRSVAYTRWLAENGDRLLALLGERTILVSYPKQTVFVQKLSLTQEIANAKATYEKVIVPSIDEFGVNGEVRTRVTSAEKIDTSIDLV